MHPFASPVLIGAVAANFVGASGVANTGSSQTISFSALGAGIGQLGVIHVQGPSGGSNTVAVSGWTKDSYASTALDYYTQTFWKVLDATDISSGVSVTGLNGTAGREVILFAAYAGPTSLTRVSQASDNSVATTVSAAGFTKNANGLGIVSVVDTQANDASQTPPAGLTARVSTQVTTFVSATLADLLVPPLYTDGSALQWSTLDASVEKVVVVHELRG